ncbi:hypothetical protein AAFF_G00085560 [Aldrovandia affinis]|uniref:Uncharacterized protein n=1 Tax=Aldrovandia affinis TaxID=143900 RepID=A0AAD7WDC1_9TELE|nr:hypothetical protein AAFF_G00085560 [Aldrovandia affinis]
MRTSLERLGWQKVQRAKGPSEKIVRKRCSHGPRAEYHVAPWWSRRSAGSRPRLDAPAHTERQRAGNYRGSRRNIDGNTQRAPVRPAKRICGKRRGVQKEAGLTSQLALEITLINYRE